MLDLLLEPEVLTVSLAADIEREITLEKSTQDWMKAVKKYISALYKEQGGNVRCTGENREFLLDLCVFSGKSMELALESEWDSDLQEILKDFEKLFYFKAPVKIMICDSDKFVRSKLLPVREWLSDYPDHRVGEEYVVFNWRGDRGVINCHSWKPTRDGSLHLEDIKFKGMREFPRIVDREKWDRFLHRDDGWLE